MATVPDSTSMKNSPTPAEDTVSPGWRAALTLHDQGLQRRGRGWQEVCEPTRDGREGNRKHNKSDGGQRAQTAA